MVKLLSKHLAKTLLSTIRASVKNEDRKWNKNNWFFPQLINSAESGNQTTVCYLASDLLETESTNVKSLIEKIKKVSKTNKALH